MKINKPFLSIIVPVYNEEKRLNRGINRILAFIDEQVFSIELIVVNDGSTDATIKLLKKLKHPSLRLISYEKNRGKGYAIREGMRDAAGAWRLFMDIDLSTPIEEFQKFLPHFKNFDVIIGSRRTKDSTVLVHQPILREWLGSVFTWLSSTILNVEISDFTCGFKCFSKNAANKLFSLARLHGWGFDSEIMFLAQKKGFLIKEAPVVWSNDSQTRVRLIKDVLISFTDIIKIRVNDVLGKYSE
ncbi:MAG: glycosyltransferase family 2 protein [Candidatus Levybacteria bacterium]|nr:glycosyltransferase family 2 protein [Candidatus Levybacteria bacterium]